MPPPPPYTSIRLKLKSYKVLLLFLLVLSCIITFMAYAKGVMDGWYVAGPWYVIEAREKTTWLDLYQSLVREVKEIQQHKPKEKRWSNQTIEWFVLRLLIASEKSGLDPTLILSVATAESGLDFHAVSRRGAVGIMQVKPETGKELGFNVYDPAQNIDAGAIYLSRLLRRYNGNLKLALAAYNAGISRVKHSLPKIRETQRYVRRVLGYYKRYVD